MVFHLCLVFFSTSQQQAYCPPGIIIFPSCAQLRTMDAADPDGERDAFIFRPAKKSKADLKAEAEARANARCKEYCKEKSKELTASCAALGLCRLGLPQL